MQKYDNLETGWNKEVILVGEYTRMVKLTYKFPAV